MFITFEGIDASGKTTFINRLKSFIEKNLNPNDFVFTREPGGFQLKECEQIRAILLNKENNVDNMSEMLLYLTSRKMHVEKLIKPALSNNKIVFSDRFFDSSIAYQGGGRKLGVDFVEQLNLKVIDNLTPDFTFYFRIDFDTSIKRLKERSDNPDRLEKESKTFFEDVINTYDYLAQKYPNRYIVIDASKSIEKIYEEVFEKLKKIINL